VGLGKVGSLMVLCRPLGQTIFDPPARNCPVTGGFFASFELMHYPDMHYPDSAYVEAFPSRRIL
jgi:hypothetical protein